MNSTLPDILQGMVGLAGMGLIFLAPGYCWARLTNVAGFQRLSRAEQALWTVILGTPLAIALCALAGRLLSTTGINVLFGLLDALAFFLLWKTRPNPAPERDRAGTRSTAWMLALMGLFGLYCVLGTTDVQIGKKLYISTTVTDWSVRVQMVRAAMRTAATGLASPPINGLTTLTNGAFGHAPHLRYYYFWYVTVAHAARTLHIDAHAALGASCAWAGWALIAAAFLTLKYMLGPGPQLRLYCFLLLLVGAVLGLDILPTTLLWLSPKLHPYPEMEWWHQDRTPSFLGAVLYAPHHMAAFCALIAAFLVLLLTCRRSVLEKSEGLPASRTPSLGQALPAAAFAGIAFAAAAGTSTFPTFCFVFVLAFWAVDLLRRSQFVAMGTLVAAGVLSLLLARPYLHELSTGSSAASGFANLRWRNDDFLAMHQARHHLLNSHGAFLAFIARQPMVLVMDFFDLGFYTLVLVQGLRVLRRKGRLSPGKCALVALVAGAAVPAFFLSSTATSGPNDLGVDAGFLLRLGLQLAAVPWVWKWWQCWRAGELVQASRRQRQNFALAAMLFLLGLSAQVYQVFSERLYYAVVGSGAVHKQMDAFTQDRLGERLYNIRSAYSAFDRMTPPSTPDTQAIQFNPVGAMQPVETIYSTHQVAAWDTGCGTSYGGDYKSCAPYFANLLFLFGNTQAGVDKGSAENDRQDGAALRVATLADFEHTCRSLHVRAILAESTDSIWRHPDSWVWTAPVLAQNDTVRILGCPAG